ncbi:DUF559 domain-containing protein [Parabacteroides sp. 52]|uniref:endonuclease domain-containing protein n=1 Tax=unclassified Parabacteroides TaxID=2649774 RepID=UPI0013D7C014|nr:MULTISPECIES: DUF559 domain-containing protein [unclassified Parabacteroides]MDH6535218.1 very-short-patch-repair endonuclease [Parabacteroides sp. PM5-20]NDV55642.1 DUF559 domain-containing protein [Parabacteroides sp. 52]
MKEENNKLMNRKEQKGNRRYLRHHATPAEKGLWKILKELRKEGLIFHRQQSIGKYIVDFYCPQIKLVIELDGQVHVGNEAYDEQREEFIKTSTGLIVLRYENRFVFEHPQCILEDVKEIRNKQSPIK